MSLQSGCNLEYFFAELRKFVARSAERVCVTCMCAMPQCARALAQSAGVQIVFYFLYGNVQIAFCFLLSCLFSRARTASIVGYLWVFGSGLVAEQLLTSLIVNERWFTFLIELVPTFSLFRCASS